MPIEKKVAARKGAAKYSTNLVSATIEYAKLKGQSLEATSAIDEYSKIKDEMLSLLPLYRHPTNDEFTENMIYFDPDFMSINGSAYKQPDFITKLEEAGIDSDTLTAIREYVRDSELRIIELAQCKDELNELKTMFPDAKKIYEENRHERSDKRNALVVQAIGLSTGHPTERINKRKAYFDYVTLVRKEGMSRNEAVKAIQKKYDFSSYDATLKLLYEYRTSLFKKWEQQHPSMLPKIKKRLKGLVPSRGE